MNTVRGKLTRLLNPTSAIDFLRSFIHSSLFSTQGHGSELILYLSKKGSSMWYMSHITEFVKITQNACHNVKNPRFRCHFSRLWVYIKSKNVGQTFWSIIGVRTIKDIDIRLAEISPYPFLLYLLSSDKRTW